MASCLRRPLVQVPAPVPRCSWDWTVPFDDLIALQVSTCTRCGVPCPDHGAVLVHELPQGLSMALRLCLRCHRQPGALEEAKALLERRYRREETV